MVPSFVTGARLGRARPGFKVAKRRRSGGRNPDLPAQALATIRRASGVAQVASDPGQGIRPRQPNGARKR